MKIKRYVVREMQEAIRLIKEDLGPEAVIISSYKVPPKGLVGLFSPRLLEVTAALDNSPDVEVQMACPPVQMAIASGNRAKGQIGPAGGPVRALLGSRETGLAPAGDLYLTGPDLEPVGPVSRPGPEAGDAPTAGAAEPAQEGETRCLFEMMVNKEMETAFNNSDPVLFWRQKLLDLDVQERIVEQLLTGAGSEETPEFHQHLYLNLIKKAGQLLEPAYQAGPQGRVMTFIGPPGAGKTTTLAKLAAKLKLTQQKKIALISVYAYHIGAMDNLQPYGDYLGVPVEVVMTPAELARLLENHSDKDYILIDTNGRSPRKAAQILELKGFLDVVREPREVFLVLDAAMKDRDLARTAGEFRQAGFSKLIFTKLDQTETLGSILNLIYGLGVPAAYLADGQGVPDDLIEARPKTIAKLLFRGVDPDEIVALRSKPVLPAGA